MLVLLSFLSLLRTLEAVQIVESSPSQVVVREGESLDLFCESSTPYQWCYWAQNSTSPPHHYQEFPTTAHQGGGEVREATLWGFQWRKSSTRCGLHVPASEVGQRGRWKCHLANTDSKEVDKIRDERWFSVSVAQPASPLLSLPSPGASSSSLETIWGLPVTVGCEAPGGSPPATVALSLEKATDRAELGAGARAQVQYYPSTRETGAVFLCRWQQVSPSGSVLYSGEERAPPLLVLQAPTLQPGTREHLVWREGLEVTASFTARPRPLEEQVQWLVLSGNSSLSVGEAGVPGQLVPLALRPVEGSGPWHWQAGLRVQALERGVALVLRVDNRAGTADFHFTLDLPPAPQPRSSKDQTPDTGLLQAGSLAGLGGGLAFALLLLLLSLVLCRQRGAGQGDKQGDDKERATHSSDAPLLTPFLLPAPTPAPCSCARRLPGLSMQTFGKVSLAGAELCPAHPPGACPRSDTLQSLTSVSTDQLSTLGVRLREFPDPLADWEELEPGLQERRSSAQARE